MEVRCGTARTYFRASWRSFRAKNLPFEMRIVALHRGAQHEAAFVGASLTARVPRCSRSTARFRSSPNRACHRRVNHRGPIPGPRSRPRAPRRYIGQRARARQVIRRGSGATSVRCENERSSEYGLLSRRLGGGAASPPVGCWQTRRRQGRADRDDAHPRERRPPVRCVVHRRHGSRNDALATVPDGLSPAKQRPRVRGRRMGAPIRREFAGMPRPSTFVAY